MKEKPLEEMDKIPIFGSSTYREVFGHSMKLYEMPTAEACREIVTRYKMNSKRIPFFFKLGFIVSFGGIIASIGSMFTSFTPMMSVLFLLLSIIAMLLTSIGLHQFYLINFIRHEYCMTHIMNNEFVDEISDILHDAIEDEEARNNFEAVFENVKMLALAETNATRMRILNKLFMQFDKEEEAADE